MIRQGMQGMFERLKQVTILASGIGLDLYFRVETRGTVSVETLGTPPEFSDSYSPVEWFSLPPVLKRFKIGSGDVFLDLGSNVGGYSLALAPAVGESGLIVSVDADPYSATRLQSVVSANQIEQVRVLNVGLADQVSELTFSPQIRGNRGGGSFLTQHNEASIRVQCITLTGLLARYPEISSIRAAKLDLEGFEHRVLKCFFSEQPRTLWPKFLLVERSVGLLVPAGGDVNKLIAAKGYRLALAHAENYIWER